MGLDSLKDGVISTIKANPIASGLAAGAIGAAGVVGTAAAIGGIRKKAKKRKKSKTTYRRRSTTYKRTNRKKRKVKYARTARKGKDTSRKRIRMTKNGQPYIILKSGKARFIKKSSARNSRKRKGGRY